MPGPRNRTKNRPRNHTGNGSASNLSVVSQSASTEAFANEVDDVNGWTEIVKFLCEYFRLPDLNRRSGLKRIHANFSEIYRKLNNAYTSHAGKEKIMGGIVAIWAKMCVDAVLRNRLVREGLIEKIMPLMDMRSTRVVGLETLATVTHHSGLEVHIDIAKHTPTLLRLMEEFPDNARINELAVSTISHAVGSAISADVYNRALVQSLDVPNVLRQVTNAMRKPTASVMLVEHGMSLVTAATRHVPEDIKALPPLVSLMAASLRVNDMSARCSAVVTFIRINHNGSEEENRHFDPQMLIKAVERRFPGHLVDVMCDYGATQCETWLLAKTAGEYQKAMMKVAQDRDLHALGNTLAELIVRTEFSVSDGGFQAYDDRGRPEMIDVGLPFKMWLDALPLCAKALRNARGATSLDLDKADILDIKFFIIRSRIPEAIAHAEKAIKRNPHVAYFYYAIGLGANQAQALRAVKKGLKAKQTTPFVKYYMLWRAIVSAGNMGVTGLAMAKAGDQEYSEGVAFLMSALDDAEEFFKIAPPDARHMSVVVNWYIVLTFAIRGHELSEDLRELEPALKRLDISRQITEHIGFPYKKTQMRLSREMMMRMWPKALKDYASTITHYSKLYEEAAHGPKEERSVTNAEDNLAAWLDDLHLEDGEEGRDMHCVHPRINSNSVELYRCSYCRNPSAALKKCSGCAKARYCDGVCQKSHWSDHKATCKTTDS
ncbi:hypothetical protein EIP91_002989 [Steccherinum ochraceum]|uniref:MYND-type domain-containing protein n=1 Tax=Steccherinum ochraceum TaxID=92696 RepID=A0A4R0REP6_9APHY|nr:hypothetical protein EIP91_002989 [Steccherinum ochraceum]